MDYGQLMVRAWKILWKHKFMILLGMIAALGTVLSTGYQIATSFVTDNEQLLERLFENASTFGPTGGVVAILAVVFLVSFVSTAIALFASGGLIAGAYTIAEEGQSTLAHALNAAWRHVWTLLGISFVSLVPILLVTGTLMGGVWAIMALSVLGGMFLGFGTVALLGGFCCLVVPLMWLSSIWILMAQQACVNEGLGVFAAYQRGLDVLKAHLGSAILVFLIQMGIGVVVGLPFGVVSALDSIAWIWKLVLLPFMWALTGVSSAYSFTLWTLAWRQWTGAAEAGRV